MILATTHIDELGLDVLVTLWDDGTGEVAYRQGFQETSLVWSPPSPLDIAAEVSA